MTLIKPPFAHQAEALALSKDKESFALLMEAGTAKTRIIIDTAAHLYGKGDIDSLIVFAPNGVHRNWLEQEVPAWLPSEVPMAAAYWQAGAGVRKRAEFEAAAGTTGKLRILTFNIEALSQPDMRDYILKLCKKRKNMAVVDESQRIKSPSSIRTRNAFKVSNLADYRRILSGTPVSMGLQDLYAQFKFLDLNILGVKTFAAFKAEFCVMGGYEGRDVIAYRNTDELRNRMKPWVYEKDKKDCLDLPPTMTLEREAELGLEQRRLYKEIQKEFITELNGNRLEAAQIGVRMIRLRQILSGFFPLGEGEWVPVPCPRLDVCADLVEEAARGKVIVWAHFQADVERLCDKFKERGIGSVPFYGGISHTQRAANLAAWRSDPRLTVIVATPATGGVGYTWNEADTVVYYSHDYNYEHRVQSEARNYRAGQTKPVTYYNLVSRGTADRRMLSVVGKKGSIAQLIKRLNRSELLNIFEEAA